MACRTRCPLRRRNEATPLLSMTDEERDFAVFQEYLRTLSPDALWDVHAHVDADRYPRRYEAVAREMQRRRLFFISPYTTLEARLRALFGTCALLALFAGIVSGLPALSQGMNTAAQSLGASAPELPGVVAPGHTIPLFSWHAGDERLWRDLLPLARCAALSGASMATLAALFGAFPAFSRRRLRLEVLVTGVLAALVAWVVYALALRSATATG